MNQESIESTKVKKHGPIDPGEEQEFTGVYRFSYKSIWTHIRDYFAKPIPLILVALTCFGVLWTIAESSIQFTGNDPRTVQSYGLLVVSSILISLVWNAYLYYTRVPEGFQNASRHAQRIAHIQRPLWEFKLAKSLLAQMIHPLDRQLDDLEQGRTFVPSSQLDCFESFNKWSLNRIDNLFELSKVAIILVTQDFPTALQSTEEKPSDPRNILSAAERMARFYEATIEFESAARSVGVPEAFKELHQLQFGWTESIRDAVRQLFSFLQIVCECHVDEIQSIKFEIEFKEELKCQEFSAAFDKLIKSPETTRNAWQA